MSILIKGGRVLTAADDYVGDVYVEGERISLIGESLDVAADKVIDAAGKYVLPGAVDPHTHLEMPFGGKDKDMHEGKEKDAAVAVGGQPGSAVPYRFDGNLNVSAENEVETVFGPLTVLEGQARIR